MVDFDALNRETRYYKNVVEPNQSWYRSQGNGFSPSENIARKNNETIRAKTGQWPARPYGPSGYTYSTGK